MKKVVCCVIVFLSLLAVISCNVEPEGENGDENDYSWFEGHYWVESKAYAPDSQVYYYGSDGIYTYYNDYACTDINGQGIWVIIDDILILDNEDSSVMKLQKDSENKYTLTWSSTGNLYSDSDYKKGYEPDGNIFNHSETVLSDGVWMEDTISHDELKLYSYTATSAGDHIVDCENDTAFTLVSAYAEDKTTAYFNRKMFFEFPVPISLSLGDKVYLIVNGCWSGDNGIFRIGITGP